MATKEGTNVGIPVSQMGVMERGRVEIFPEEHKSVTEAGL